MEQENGPSGGERTDGGPRPDASRPSAQSKRARISESAGRPNTRLGQVPSSRSLRRATELPAERQASRGAIRGVWFVQSRALPSVIRGNDRYRRSAHSKRPAAARGKNPRSVSIPFGDIEQVEFSVNSDQIGGDSRVLKCPDRAAIPSQGDGTIASPVRFGARDVRKRYTSDGRGLVCAADAAERKRVAGPVIGAADVLLFPNLVSANLAVKAIMYTADCRYGG